LYTAGIEALLFEGDTDEDAQSEDTCEGRRSVAPTRRLARHGTMTVRQRMHHPLPSLFSPPPSQQLLWRSLLDEVAGESIE
jgi:hypothetical protein